MASLFRKLTQKESTTAPKLEPVDVSKKPAVKAQEALPDDFFEQILACEIQLKKGFAMATLRKLINLYSTAVEYFESRNDPRYKRYSKSLQILLLQPQIVKQINMQTKKGQIKVRKQERKKEILNEFKNLDKKFANNDNVKELISNTKDEEKKMLFESSKNKDLDNQSSNFKKRLEDKKKKWKMNTSDIGSSSMQSQNLVVFTAKQKHLNKSFDCINQEDSFLSSDLSIEPISMYNFGDNNFNITDSINSNLDFYFSDFDSLFTEKITKNFIGKIIEINQEKMQEKIKTAREFAEKIKNKEYELTFDVNLSQDKKDNIGKEILSLGEEQKKVYDDIEEKYKQKINQVKEDIKNQGIQNMEWIKNLKEKYTSDIDSAIYNYIGN